MKTYNRKSLRRKKKRLCEHKLLSRLTMKMYKTKEALHQRQTNGYELNLKYTEKNYKQKVTHLRGTRKRNTNFDSWCEHLV